MKILNNINTKIGLIITISFTIGFSIATMTYLALVWEESVIINLDTPEKKCDSSPTKCIPIIPPINNTKINNQTGIKKVEFLQSLVSEPIIQDAVKKSNKKDSAISKDIRDQIYIQTEKIWTTAVTPTPFMLSIVQNDVSDYLRKNHVGPFEGFGDIVFGEHIITNQYGANVAVSVITDNFLQSNDDWWQKAKNNPEELPFARECEFDSSAQMFSEDLVVGIYDEKHRLIGIMNSATPCDVTQHSLEQSAYPKYIPIEKISDIGKFKMSILNDLVTNSQIQQTLEKSNQEFLSVSAEDLAELKKTTPWPSPEKKSNELQREIINNEVSDLLRDHQIINSTQFGKLDFPEMILTNSKGVTVASTNRTYDYIQYFEDWWIVASENDFLVRQCGFDKSIGKSSEDIVIPIFDQNDQFIGILNAANYPCNIISEKEGPYYGDSN